MLITYCHARSVHGPRPKPNLKQYFNNDGDFDVEDDLDNDKDWKESKEDECILKEDENFLSCTLQLQVNVLTGFKESY